MRRVVLWISRMLHASDSLRPSLNKSFSFVWSGQSYPGSPSQDTTHLGRASVTEWDAQSLAHLGLKVKKGPHQVHSQALCVVAIVTRSERRLKRVAICGCLCRRFMLLRIDMVARLWERILSTELRMKPRVVLNTAVHTCLFTPPGISAPASTLSGMYSSRGRLSGSSVLSSWCGLEVADGQNCRA